MGWFDDKLEELYHQVRVGDNKTAATVRAARQKAPAQLPTRAPKKVSPTLQALPKRTNSSGINVGSFRSSGIIEDFLNSPRKTSRGADLIRQGQYKQGVGKVASGLIEGPLGVVPIGRVGSAGMQAGQKFIPKVVNTAKFGAKQGAGFGGAYGASSAMEQNQSIPTIAKTALVGGAVGAVGGGVLGGASPVLGAGLRGGRRAAPVVAKRIDPNYAVNQHISLLESSKRGKSVPVQRQIDKAIAEAIKERARRNQGGYVGPSGKDPLSSKGKLPLQASQSNKGQIPSQPLNQASKGSVQASKGSVQPQVQLVTERVAPRVQPALQEASLPPAVPGTQTIMGGQPPQLPAVIPQPKGKETRFASKTVPESEFVSKPIKGSIKAPEYSPQTEKQGYSHSLGKLKEQGDEVFEQDVFTNLNKKPGTISRQEAIDSTTLAQILDSKGDDISIRKATEIYEKLSEHYTAAGQTIQVAAILSRRTPEGMRGWATSTLLKEGVTPTPQLQAQIVGLAQKKDIAGLADLVSKNIPSSTGDKIINFWRAGLLTAPTTTGGNLLGNTGEALVRKGFVNPVATAADVAMSAVTGKRSMTLSKSGEYGKGFKKGAKEFGKGTDNSKYDVQRRTNYDNKLLDKYVNSVYRLMGIADKPFSRAAERESLSSLAKAEAINKGLKGADRDKFVKEFIDNPPEQALLRAEQEGDYAVFKNPTTLGKAATGLKKPLGPVGDFLVPFTQVPASIATRIVERTPIGTAREVVKQIKHIKSGGEFDQRAMSQAIGNGAFGPAVIGAGYALANSNLLTFGYPTDKKERALWEEEGKQPYSVRVGDRWYSLNYLQPFGALLAVGGQASKVAKEGGDISEVVGQGVATAAQSITNQSFLKGISGALEAVTDPERNVRKYVEQTTSSVIPNFARSFARASDPIQREPEGVVEGIKSGVPSLRGSTTPKYSDITGDPLPAKDNFANQYFNPLRPSKARDAGVTAELRNLQGADEGILPVEVKKDTFGKGQEVSKPHIKRLNSEIAKATSSEWDKVISDPRYKNLSSEDKRDVLQVVSNTVSAGIKAQFAAKNGYINDNWEPNLTKKQESYLTGEMIDYLGEKEKKIVKDKTKKTKVAVKKPAKKKTAKKGSKKGGSKKAKKGKYDYKLFQFAPSPSSFSKSLRQLVEDAKVRGRR